MRLLFLFFILTGSAFARIGESPKEINSRYDKATPSAVGDAVIHEGRIIKFGQKVLYQSEGWTITAIFINGKCERIQYKKTGSWTNEHVYAVLNANANDQTWSKDSPFDNSRKRWIGVGSSSADWNMVLGFDIKSDYYSKHVEKLKKRATAKSKAVPNF